MKKETKELLEEVAVQRLTLAKEGEVGSRETMHAFKEGMEAIKELNNADTKKKSDIIKAIEVAAIPVTLFVADCIFKAHMSNKLLEFETSGTVTSSTGKGFFGSLFRFKK